MKLSGFKISSCKAKKRASKLAFFSGTCVLLAFTLSAQAQEAKLAKARKISQYHPESVLDSAKEYYVAAWGVDNLMVHQTASGNLIRFSYRVVEPSLAKALGDKEATPVMIGQKSHAALQVPVMDKVGQLRQTSTVEKGKEYWMVFSNKGGFVKTGERVDVKIGSFHADGLLVE